MITGALLTGVLLTEVCQPSHWCFNYISNYDSRVQELQEVIKSFQDAGSQAEGCSGCQAHHQNQPLHSQYAEGF